jgi:hypothetical protein
MFARREGKNTTATEGSKYLQAKLDEPPRKGDAEEDDLPRVGRVGRQDERREPDEAVDIAEYHPVSAAEG